jgi:hypothetical protein
MSDFFGLVVLLLIILLAMLGTCNEGRLSGIEEGMNRACIQRYKKPADKVFWDAKKKRIVCKYLTERNNEKKSPPPTH